MRHILPVLIITSNLLLQGCYTLVSAPADPKDMVIKNVPTAHDFFLSNSYALGVTGWDPWWEPSYSPYGFDSYYSYLNPFDAYNGYYAASYPYSQSYMGGYYGSPGYVPSWGLGRISVQDSIGVARNIGRDDILGTDRFTSRTPVTEFIQQQQISAATSPFLNTGSLERTGPNSSRVYLQRKYHNRINFNPPTPTQNAASAPAAPAQNSNAVAKPNPQSSPRPNPANMKAAPASEDREEIKRPRQKEHTPSDNASRK